VIPFEKAEQGPTTMSIELDRLRKRFEIAAQNFGRSCISMKANEKAFQAWYAACVIQEFGLSRVYREVHLSKRFLKELIGDEAVATGIIEEGNELFPDLSVSWEPDVDARHSRTRTADLKHAGAMLQQFGILSELKVTGSTSIATSKAMLRKDLRKLAEFLTAYKAAKPLMDIPKRGLAAYLVVLDNFWKADKASPRFEEKRMNEFLRRMADDWPTGIKKPDVLLILPDGMRTYRQCDPVPE
jgi:hypothetical protein